MNNRLAEACKRAVEDGHAEVVHGSAIRFTGPIDQEKLRQVEESYANAFNARFEKRRRKEIEAWRKLRREGFW